MKDNNIVILGQKYEQPVYWLSPVGGFDDFGRPIEDEFIDGMTRHMQLWAIMTPESFQVESRHRRLGTGLGQRYRKQSDGRWLKVEG